MNKKLVDWLIKHNFQYTAEYNDAVFRKYTFVRHDDTYDEDLYIRDIIRIDKHNYGYIQYEIYYSHIEPGLGTMDIEFKKRYPQNYELTIKDMEDFIKFFNIDTSLK